MISREVSNPKEELVQVERKITKTLDTLFTLCSEVEFKDENHVSVFTRIYGYEFDKYTGGIDGRYATIGLESSS